MNSSATGFVSVTGLLAAGLNPLQALWFQFIQYIPQIIAAAIIMLVGWALGVIFGDLATRVIRYTGVDKWVRNTRLNERLRIDHGSRYALLSGMIGSLIKWII